ncbi:hypothetical protein K1719_039847 [Acacia pycnantha]|nr:hypothetical protein K1719_039847 [Acacia pycnantha]
MINRNTGKLHNLKTNVRSSEAPPPHLRRPPATGAPSKGNNHGFDVVCHRQPVPSPLLLSHRPTRRAVYLTSPLTDLLTVAASALNCLNLCSGHLLYCRF